MTSGKQARRQRQAAARPPVRSTEGRRASPTVLFAALAGVLGIALVVVLVIVLTGGNSGSSGVTGTTLPDSDVIAQQFQGVPQQGSILGKASAPVTMIEYIDLQCPICRQFETEVFPTIVQRYVRPGKVRVDARPIAFIGPDSERGRRGMIAAEQQNKGFNFAQILYFNQGPENGGWLNETMVANAVSSKPTMLTSSGTTRPMRCATLIVAAAMSSLLAKIAVGRSARASSRSPAVSPER
jgi:hypothetical protein